LFASKLNGVEAGRTSRQRRNGRSTVATKWHMTWTFIGEHSPRPSTPSSVKRRTSAVRILSG